MLRVWRRKSVSRHLRSERLRHRTSIDRRNRAGGVGCHGRAGECRGYAARSCLGELLSITGQRPPPRKRSPVWRNSFRYRVAETRARCPFGTSEAGREGFFDWPIADVAVLLDRDQAGLCRRVSIVLGAAAPVPHRAKAAEATLDGKPVNEQAARDAAHAALAGATPLAKNAYKLPIFETLVRRAILAAAKM